MRKYLVLFALTSLLLALVACGGDDGEYYDNCSDYTNYAEYANYDYNVDGMIQIGELTVYDESYVPRLILEDLQPQITEWTFPVDFATLRLDSNISIVRINSHDEDFVRVNFEIIPHFAVASPPNLMVFDKYPAFMALSQIRLPQENVGSIRTDLRTGTVNLNHRLIIYDGELLVEPTELLDIDGIYFFDQGIITIYLPKYFDGDIVADNGLSVEDSIIHANIIAQATNQSINITNSYIFGDISLYTSNGSINIINSHIGGILRGETRNGSIWQYNVEVDMEAAELTTQNGTIVINGER